MAKLRTYSVVIRWSNSYSDMGDFGDYVRARDGTHAERILRARMAKQVWSEREEGETKAESLELYRDAFGNLFGAVTECHEGAIWKAAELKVALGTALGLITKHGLAIELARSHPEDFAHLEAARSVNEDVDRL